MSGQHFCSTVWCRRCEVIWKRLLAVDTKYWACRRASTWTVTSSSGILFSACCSPGSSSSSVWSEASSLQARWRMTEVYDTSESFLRKSLAQVTFARKLAQVLRATDLRWGENFNTFLFRNSLLYIAVKKIRKWVNICQSYHKNKRVSFFNGLQCSLMFWIVINHWHHLVATLN